MNGDLILFVVNDHGELRSYRVDRIAGIRPTATTFRQRSSSNPKVRRRTAFLKVD